MLLPFRDLNPIRSTPVVTYAIVAVNVLAFLWMLTLPKPQEQLLVLERGFIPARIGQLFDPEPLTVEVPGEQFLTPRGVVVRMDQVELPPESRQILLSLITCMFLHGGWWHLIGNMWFLLVFGNNVEDRLGPAPYLLFYLGGGIIASAAQWFIAPQNTTPVIGASGAVAAVLGAYAITWPWARVQTLVFLIIFFTIIELPALAVLGFWFVGQLLEASRSLTLPGNHLEYTNVAWWAHIGGFLAGAISMPLLCDLVDGYSGQRREEPPPDAREEQQQYSDEW